MSACNVVRFKVKTGREQEFLDAHRRMAPEFTGFRKGAIVKTGDRTFCFIGGWDRFEDLAVARDGLIRLLDSFRDTLEDHGAGLGVTDPASGPVVMDIGG